MVGSIHCRLLATLQIIFNAGAGQNGEKARYLPSIPGLTTMPRLTTMIRSDPERFAF